MMKKAKNHMRDWTPSEERRMRQLARRRMSSRAVASKLGRSPGATRYKAMVLGVRFRSIDRTA
jgi:hypothetical protein